jgi:CheY-like chemotaxis protein
MFFPGLSPGMENQQTPDQRPPLALVVDDEPLVRTDTADVVADEGFDVIEVRTVDEAFPFLVSHPSLRLLVTDVQTPGEMDGFELARQVAERWPHICVVVASGATRPEDGELPDAAIFLRKPISSDVVHEAIEEYCRCTDVR